MAWLLDTNVVSELWKPNANRQVTAVVSAHAQLDQFISAVSLAEIQYGIDLLAPSPRRIALEGWINSQVRPQFQYRILPVTEQVLIRWMALVAEGRRRNHTYSQPDLFLAATALEHDLTLVTRNTKDFATIPNLKLLNPWEPQP